MNQDAFLNSTTQTLAWFRKRVQDGEIELKPAFQREGVWSDKQKSYLIDTMLKGLPVPEMYLQEHVDDAGNERFTVVDGQQRLRACMDFLDGELVLIGEDVGDLAGLKFADLTPEQRQALFSYKFVVRKLPDSGEPLLRDIFRRINKNTVSLNPQEIRHATYWGEFIKSAELLANLSAWADLGVFTPNDIRRMRHVEFVSEVLLARLYGDQEKKKNLEQAYIAFESNFDQRKVIQSSLSDSLVWLVLNFEDFVKTRWRKKSDFYSLWIVLSAAGYGGRSPSKRYVTEPELVVAKLRNFGGQVDQYLKVRSHSDELVTKYGNAVERAASDLANRRARREVLESLLMQGQKT